MGVMDHMLKIRVVLGKIVLSMHTSMLFINKTSRTVCKDTFVYSVNLFHFVKPLYTILMLNPDQDR